MKLFSGNVFCSALLLVTSADAFSFDLSKRALKFDASCNTKYGSLTAKQLIDKSINLQPKIAKAGKDGLDVLIAALEYQSKAPGAKKPSVRKGELDKIIATYRVLFGDIKPKNDDGTPNPTFNQEAAAHIAAIKVTRDALNRMTRTGNPDLIIHCNDDWLSERGPKNAGPKPTEPLKPGSQYFYDMDRNRWVKLKGGKPCQGNRATATTPNKKLSGTTREKGPERVTFCKQYLKRQQQLEKDKQPHLWDVSKSKLPDTFTTYTQAGKKDETLPFHISAFGSKIGAKWLHEFMQTGLFNPSLSAFSDKPLQAAGGTGGIAHGFDGAVKLAKQKGGKNIAESSRNIDSILYWSLAMYYNKWVWSTGKPEDPSTLTPVTPGTARRDLQIKAAAKKPPKKTTQPADPPKTEKPADPPKTDPPPPPPKTEAPADPPKTSTQAAPPASTQAAPPTSTQAAPPASTQPAPPASNTAPATSAPQTQPPLTQLPTSKPTSTPSPPPSTKPSTPLSCTRTLCTQISSPSPSPSPSSIPEETLTTSPLTDTLRGAEILALADLIATEQTTALRIWDQVFADMGLLDRLPSGTGDATASAGTGLPMPTGGAGARGNGTWTWSKPVLRAGGERRMYDFAS